MKNKFILSLIAIFAIATASFAQRVYGVLNASSGEVTLTSEIAYAEQKLKESLNDPGAALSNFAILKDADNTVFLLTADVTNSKDGITAIGVELYRTGFNIHGSAAAAGPGVKHTCKGNPCNSCKFSLKPFRCECRGEGKCDHVVEVLIGI